MLLEALETLRENSFIPHPYKSVDDMWRDLGIQALRPCKHGWWRLTNAVAGEIHGIPSINGLCLATDGLICLIVRHDGVVFTAHLANFTGVEKLEIPVQSFDSYNGRRVPKATRELKKKKHKPMIEEFC